ncbi:MAG TPA: ABC transporter ATP-binding protein, partial [Anaerolineales bacterium]|nr:ABC transporter ATP-binding protein [Anaerolineales bacterium]
PLIDVGTLKLIKEGHLKVQPGIQEFTPGGVKFTDGQQCNFDAVILATGFRPRVNSFLEENSTSVDQEGTPLQSGRMAASPGLYFCGYYIAPTGMLREIGMEAKQISASIAARKTSKWRNTHSMSNYTIETYQLTKRFGDVLAVDCVNLRVKPGEIYGFLGLNGAGKTTTIRALLGMIRPSAGKLRVLGRDVGPNGRGPWARVGHLVETPSAYPELTVRENLQVAARLHGISDSDAARRVIEQLNLGSYADRKAGTLSMGNLQRLGLARALLHGPELLILDEPANGLDPAGVVEIRELLQRLARKNGVTIFMSSHILTEVDQLATRIGIIHRGQLIEELDTDQLERLRSQQLEVKTRNLEAAQLSLRSAGYKFRIEDETMVFDDEYAIEHPDDVARILVNAGNPPIRLAVVQQNLEDHFLQLTNDRRKGNGVAEEAKA